MPVGAIVINPNNPERIAKVLDEIINNANMKNKFFIKIIFENGTIRKLVVFTSDGLPYKAMIELIKNEHVLNVGKNDIYI